MVDVNKIKGLITERGLSQQAVAAHLGMCSKTFYSRLARGVFSTREAEMLIELLKIEDAGAVFFKH